MIRRKTRGAGIGNSGKNMHAKTTTQKPLLENLEPRQMLASVSLSGGVLTVNGDTNSTNNLAVNLDSSGRVVAKYNNSTKTYSKSSVSSIVIRGGNKNDYLAVTSSLNIGAKIYGQDGKDTVWAGNGNDTVYGGPGDDQLNGRGGNDELHGEGGNDTIDGGAGTDKYSGGDGTNKYTAAETKVASPSGGTGGSTGSGTPTTPTNPTPTDPIPGNGTTGTPSAVISAQVSSITAGNAVQVHALASTLNGGSPITARYEWDFGDSSGKYNKLVGWNAAHIYDNPGTYTITLRLANEGGKSDTATKTITVTSDNRRTIYVSNSGSDSNNGSQGSPIKTLGKAESMLGGSSNVKILLERGDVFSVTDSINASGDNIEFGAYGSGTIPQIRWDGSRLYRPIISLQGSNQVVENISFTTKFTDREKDSMPDAILAGGHNIAVRGVEFLNVGNGVNSNAQPVGVLVQDSTAPSDVGLRSYFVWVEGNDHVLLGNRVANSTREAIFRISRNAQRTLLYGNDFTNRSRVSAGDRLDVAKNTLTVQWGSYAYIANNTLNNGPVRVGPLGEADGMTFYNSRFNYTVLENNRFNTPTFTLHGASHTMWRNNISVSNGYTAHTIEGYNSQYNRGVVNVSMVNNTVTNNSDRGKFLEVGGSANGINLVNNLYVAPNLTPGNFAAAPVVVYGNDLGSFKYISNNVWAKGKPLAYAQGGMNYVWSNWSNSAGYQTPEEWNSRSQVGTDLFSDVSVDSRFAPGTSSVAANAGRLYGGVFTDFYGKYRPSSGAWSAGAVEV